MVPRKTEREKRLSVCKLEKRGNVTEGKQYIILFCIHIICRGNCTAKVHIDTSLNYHSILFNEYSFSEDTDTISKRVGMTKK